MKLMENVEQIMRNLLHVLEVVNLGLIILNPKRLSLKFIKCRLVVHALGPWTTILELDDLFTYGQALFMPATL